MSKALTKTDFHFPGQKSVYHGKVRDVYNINDEKLVMVATDRISAFDVVLPEGIPYKGQMLNTPEGMRLQKKDGVLEVVCMNGRMKVAPTDKDGRIFNPVPGFSFIPLQVFPDSPDKKIQVKIIYN